MGEPTRIDALAASGVIVGFGDKGASLPARPMVRTPLTIPLNSLGDVALLSLPKGVTRAELHNIVRYIETLLMPEVPDAD